MRESTTRGKWWSLALTCSGMLSLLLYLTDENRRKDGFSLVLKLTVMHYCEIGKYYNLAYHQNIPSFIVHEQMRMYSNTNTLICVHHHHSYLCYVLLYGCDLTIISDQSCYSYTCRLHVYSHYMYIS